MYYMYKLKQVSYNFVDTEKEFGSTLQNEI